MDPPLGTIVTIPQGRGTVRFCGPTSFSTGKWVGIELAEPTGKNDGSVAGVAYFTCTMGHGVFVRQSQIKAMHGSELDAAGPSARPPATVRPTLGHQRTSSTSGLLRSSSLKSPPSTVASTPSPRAGSPAKPTVPATPAAARRPGPPSPVKRTPSLALAPGTRKSFPLRQSPQGGTGSSVPPSPSSRGAPSRLGNVSPNGIAPKRTSSPLSLPPRQATPPPAMSPQPQPAPAPAPVPAPAPIAPAASEDELTSLHAKLRILEAKRADSARHTLELESRLADAESFVALRPKLQSKLASQQTELIALRRDLADALARVGMGEGRAVDAQEQLEMAMLDREVAEERAEIAEAEVEELRERVAVMEVEMGVLRGGAEGSAEGDVPVKSSLAYIQLEKHNERLKEALVRLRDMSQETEQEQRRRIAEMESDIAGLDELQAQYSESLSKLSNAETQIDDLKLQLDDALGAEDMLVQLTERNLMLGEKIEEMRITIEDLEALQELNDELEENHVETEKQMQEDLDAKDVQLREHVRKIEQLEETCQDLENTIGQFRDLVLQLQGDLDALRTATQTAQTESAASASATAAILSQNLKLQSSFAKNQARAVELDVTRLEARESRELLSIVQPYLPALYVENDSDATSCYLLFQRMAYKTELVGRVVGMAHGLPEALGGEVSGELVGVCEMRGRLSGLSTVCKRFAAVLRRCDVETFLNIGRIYPEIASLEKRIDMHIDLLRRDEFRVMECVSDVAKIQSQFDHLAETYFSGFEHDLAERELGYLLAFDNDLDMFLASVGLARTSVTTVMKDQDVTLDMGGYDVDTELLEPLQKLLEQSKGAKALSKKLMKRLDDLGQDSAAIKPHLIPQMKALSDSVAELVNFGISLAQSTAEHVRDARDSKSAFQLTTVLAQVKKLATQTVAKDLKPGASPWEAIAAPIAQLLQESGKLLPLVLEAENVVKVTGIAPWVTRVEEIKAALAVNVEAERKAAQLNEEIQGLARSLKTKDQTIQESAVKIELMERRMEAVKKQADKITDLEGEISKARKQERAYEEAMEQLQADLDTLEQDNAKLKTMTAGQERQVPGTQMVEAENVPIEGSLETSYLLEQIEALRGTVRFLRTENSYLKGQDLLREIESLPPLPEPIPRIHTPPLDPSGLSDTDDSDSESPRTPPTLRSLATETKLLYRDVIKFSSSPRVVDLSALTAKRAEAKGGKVWMPRKKMPAHHILERKLEAERLSRRVHGLLERTNVIEGNA